MKSIKITLITLFGLALFSSNANAQMVGTDCFLMGNNIEIGLHQNGYPGSAALPPFPTHWVAGPARLCYVANPDESDPWDLADPAEGYDGGFYMPGSPENRIGIEIDGTTTWNSSAAGSSITSYGLSDYNVYGKCKSVTWSGTQSGIDMDVTYIIDTTKVYYRMAVTLENTTGSTINNIYFYYSADPDNNQFIGWGFGTTNTVVAQPTPFCPKALVTATQSSAWDNYLGYGGIGDDIRVARGSFFVTDGSDVYDGTGPMIGIVGSTAFADQAIAIAHRDVTLAPGEISEFEFVVIMSEAELEEALTAQYYLDYDGSDPYALCYEEPEPDTLYAECAGSTELSITGPMLDAYTWTWTNDLTGEEVGTGPTITVTPGGTTHYVVTGEPMGDCFVLPITREVVVVATGVGPDLELTDPGPQCGTFNLDDLVYVDTEGIGGTFVEFYSEFPDSMMDPTDILPPGTEIGPDDEAWILMGDPTGGCYDVEPIIIEFIEISAGLDSTGFEICNSGIDIADLETFLVDTMYIAEGSMWEEVTLTGGAFDPVTLEFDPTDVPAGEYVIRHIALGGLLCENDTSLHTITVYDQPTAGLDGDGVICNLVGLSFDLNTLLIGHDDGGFWSEVTPTGGAFNSVTGILTIDGVIASGDYTFEYTVIGTPPCIDDVSEFTISIIASPAVVDAGPDQSICNGESTTVTASGDPGVYIWSPADIFDGVEFTPPIGTTTYVVTVTNEFGCVSSDSLDIVVHPLPNISFTGDSLVGCSPFGIDFSIVSDVEIATTDWFFGDGGIAPGVTFPTVTHVYEFGGLYDVRATVTDIYGCVSSVEYDEYITVITQPIAAFTMSPQSVFTNDTRVEFTNESLHATDYVWDFADGSPLLNDVNPSHEFPQDPGDVFYPVELEASNYLGCKDSAILYLQVKSIILFYIPNTFTPDGDQFNETFQPVFESGFDPYDFHMVIYNRWGEIVFETYDASIGWDGTYGSQGLVDDGVYTWQIDFKEAYTDARHTHTGHITVLK